MYIYIYMFIWHSSCCYSLFPLGLQFVWPFSSFVSFGCVLVFFPFFLRFRRFLSFSVVCTDVSLVSVSLPRFLLCFSWLYCSLTGCLRFSAGFSGFCSCSVNGFRRCHQEFHCKFPWLLLLAALFDGLQPVILFMRDLLVCRPRCGYVTT